MCFSRSSDHSMQCSNGTHNTGVHTKVTWASLLISLFYYNFIVRKITSEVLSVAVAYKVSCTLLHVVYKDI